MNTLSDIDFINLCKKQITQKLQLGGDAGRLRSRDLEYLSAVIEEASDIKLSLSTLKRIWKKDYDQMPHPATLNALVAVLGYEDWQDFKQNYPDETVNPVLPKPARNYAPLLVPVVLCSLLFLVVFNRRDTSGLSKLMGNGQSVEVDGEVIFTADKMEAVGVPNTVIFHYDVSQVKADSFFIQQSWNPRHKVHIDPAKHDLSNIYYSPGFHFARLIANDSILKLLPVHIRTEGWLPLVKYDIRDEIPIYLPAEKVEKNGLLQVSEAILTEAGVDIEREFYLRYYRIQDYGAVYFDNFRVKTRLWADSIRNLVCPLAELMIITEVNVSYISLTPKGCVANLKLLIGEQYRSAVDNDLSAFGTDVYKAQDLELTIVNKHATIKLNDRPIYEQSFHQDFGKVVGAIITFKGPGSVDYLRIEPLGKPQVSY